MIKVSAGIPPDGRRAARTREEKNTVGILLIKGRVTLKQREMRGFFVCLLERCYKERREKQVKGVNEVFFCLFFHLPKYAEHKTFSQLLEV